MQDLTGRYEKKSEYTSIKHFPKISFYQSYFRYQLYIIFTLFYGINVKYNLLYLLHESLVYLTRFKIFFIVYIGMIGVYCNF